MKTSFDKNKHEYLIDGKLATGVTTVISVLAKPALIGWAAKMAVEHIRENAEYKPNSKILSAQFYEVSEQVLEEAKTAHTNKKEAAGVHGTDTHALVEGYINILLKENGGRPDMSLGIPEQIEKFVAWAQENVDHFLFAERRMYCAADRDGVNRWFAGTADFGYISKNGERIMADFKTSTGIYWEMWLQTAAYQFLAEHEGDEQYNGRAIVRLGKDGKFEAKIRYDYETDKKCFLACLEIYRGNASYDPDRGTKSA